jgi:hypothetical protein
LLALLDVVLQIAVSIVIIIFIILIVFLIGVKENVVIEGLFVIAADIIAKIINFVNNVIELFLIRTSDYFLQLFVIETKTKLKAS